MKKIEKLHLFFFVDFYEKFIFCIKKNCFGLV